MKGVLLEMFCKYPRTVFTFWLHAKIIDVLRKHEKIEWEREAGEEMRKCLSKLKRKREQELTWCSTVLNVTINIFFFKCDVHY